MLFFLLFVLSVDDVVDQVGDDAGSPSPSLSVTAAEAEEDLLPAVAAGPLLLWVPTMLVAPPEVDTMLYIGDRSPL